MFRVLFKKDQIKEKLGKDHEKSKAFQKFVHELGNPKSNNIDGSVYANCGGYWLARASCVCPE
jgi:hypothetical protein